MDIFQRTLCCHPLVEKPKEIEIYEADTVEDVAEEEQEAQLEEESIDVKALMQELDCLKRRIQAIQLRIKTATDECPEEECVDFEVLLNCSKNKEICSLQKNQYKLQCQVNELVKCCKAAKDHIEDLHFRMCERTKEIVKLQKLVDMLVQWRNTLDHEFGKCIERFEYLKHVKAEWQDVTEKLEQQSKCYAVMKETFVPKVCFMEEKKSFISTINEFKDMLKELFEYQLQRFDCLERRLDKVTVGQ